MAEEEEAVAPMDVEDEVEEADVVVDVAGRKRGKQLRNLSKNIQNIRSGKLISDMLTSI